MRICFIAETFYPVSAGVGNSTRSLAAVLAAQGHEVQVITPRLLPESPSYESLEGFCIVRPGNLRPQNASRAALLIHYLRFAIGALAHIVVRFQPDAVLGQTAWVGGFLAALAGLCRRRLVSMVHTHGEPRLCNAMYAPARFAYRHCRRILTTNRAFAVDAMAWGAPGPVYLSGNIVEEARPVKSKEELRQRLNYAPGFFHAVCVGRLVYEHGLETKGFSYVLKALPKLSGVMLHIYGDGDSRREFEALARAEGVGHRAVFHGAVARDVLYQGLSAADALLIPSLSEGLSMTMIEGMMLGLPVIITRTAGAMDYVRDGENGLLIEPGSVEAVVEALGRLKKYPALAESLGAAGYATYKEHFTAERVAQSFLAAVDGTGETA